MNAPAIDAPLPRLAQPQGAGTGIAVPAVVLAAGAGTRLRPVTSDLAKPLVPILNVPLLYWIAQSLHGAGATALVANTHCLGAQLTAAAERLRARDGLDITLVQEARLSGPAGGLAACRDALPPADCYVVFSGDAWAEFDIPDMVRAHRRAGADLTILAATVPDPRRFGVLEVGSDLTVTRLAPRSATAPADALVSCGIYVVGEAALRVLRPAPDGAYDFADVVGQLRARNMVVKAHVLAGYWNDIGDPAAYLDVNLRALGSPLVRRVARPARDRLWQQGKAEIAVTCTLSGPVLAGPGAVAGPGTVLDRAVLGAGSRIGAGAVVTGSVVLPGAAVAAGRVVAGEIVR